MHQHDARRLIPQTQVVAFDAVDEIVQLGDYFHPREPSARDDERHQFCAQHRIGLDVGLFKRAQDMVAQR